MNKLEVENKLKNNKLPKGWVKVRLDNLGKTYTGLSGKNKEDFGEGKPYIPYMNIYSNRKIDLHKLEYVKIKSREKQNTVKYRDIFFTTSSETPDEVGIISVLLKKPFQDIYLNSFCFGFRLNNFNSLMPEFASFYLRGRGFRKSILKLAQGSTRYNLSKNNLLKIEITFPISLTEQRKITDILETVDETIKKTDAIIEKYKRIKQGLMQDLLTRGIDENGQIRCEETHKFKNSPLGRIPEEWEVKRIIDAIGMKRNLIIAGPFGSNLKVSDYKKSGIPLIRLQNIEENKFINKDIKYISKKKAKELYYHSFKNGDIVLAKLGIPVGKTCIIPKNLKFGIVVSDVVRIRVFDEREDKEFITYILNYNICRKRLNMEIIGTTRPRVNLTQIRSLQLPLPPLPEQKRTASILSQVNETIEKEQKYKQKFEQIKQGLMENLLSGKVRVNHIIKEGLDR